MSLTTNHIKVKGEGLLWGNVRLVTRHGEQRRTYMKGGLLEGYSRRNVRLVTRHGEQRRACMKGGLLEGYSRRNVRLVTRHGEQRRAHMKGGLLEGYSRGNVRLATRHGEPRRTCIKGSLLPESIGFPHSVQKKQAAHVSRVPRLLVTCCPEFVVWTTPAGPDAGRHGPRDRPAGRDPSPIGPHQPPQWHVRARLFERGAGGPGPRVGGGPEGRRVRHTGLVGRPTAP